MKKHVPLNAQLKAWALILASLTVGKAEAQLQFVYTSDAHYGITRARFQQSANVNAKVVNAAMIAKMNELPTLNLPDDGGVNEGKSVGNIDYVMMTGDIANRQEKSKGYQSATQSWAQFKTDYIDGITLKNKNGEKTPLFILPGNHDVTNAIGFYKTLAPKTDSASMVNIYGLMMPTVRPTGNYNYANERIHYSKNMGGIHFMFVCMWPDSAERVWMEADLARVKANTPVFIFTHDQPEVETKHFTNPNGAKTINATDKFENLLLEVFKGGKTVSDATTIEQRNFAAFVKKHPNIVAYFHGNDNRNNYYTYTGPDKDIALSIFQVDSPMKGTISGADAADGIGNETKLSFQLVSIDTVAQRLTVRECLWNTDTVNTSTPIVFGQSKTISINVAQVEQAHNSGYVVGDFHQHTTFSDGSYTLDYMMSKNNLFKLDWWANSEHGGGFATDGLVSGKNVGETGSTTYWDSYTPNPIIGTVNGTPHQNMWRWQSLRDYSFAGIQKARATYPDKLILQSYEMNVPGHEHGSMGLIANQFDYNPNVNPLAQFEFSFDASDKDQTGGVAQGWTKSTNTNHAKTLEALAWLKTNYPKASYLVPAHPERKKLYKINDFRDMNNVAPEICFGFESMPGHQKAAERGGYSKSAFGSGTYGGTGVFSAKVGGLWDAMLSEGRNWWLFSNSDCHFITDDFFPGEYQKNYTYVTDKSDPQALINGLRSGNTWVVTGDLIDSLVYTASSTSDVAQMGQKLTIDGNKLTLHIKVRNPQTANNNTYSIYNKPELNHIDVIAGVVTDTIARTDKNYTIDTVATTRVIARFGTVTGEKDINGVETQAWTDLGNGWKEMSLSLIVGKGSYYRLRGSNLGLNIDKQTDGAGNPLSDTLLIENDAVKAFDDLWFYSNPIFVSAKELVNVESISIAEATASVEKGKKINLTASVLPANASVKDIKWSTSDASIATVVNGEVTGLKIGKVSIIATTEDGNKADTCLLTVTINTALSNNELRNNYTIAPNPAKEITIISSNNGNIINSIDVINANGQTILNRKANSSSIELNLSNYSKGYYIVIIRTNNEVVSKQLIIQ